MVLKYAFGEWGKVNPIRCKKSPKEDADLTGAIAADSFVYILSEDLVNLLMTITNTDFSITTPNINWTPTKVQSEKIPPGNYISESWVKIGTSHERFKAPVYIEKSRQNLTPLDF